MVSWICPYKCRRIKNIDFWPLLDLLVVIVVPIYFTSYKYVPIPYGITLFDDDVRRYVYLGHTYSNSILWVGVFPHLIYQSILQKIFLLINYHDPQSSSQYKVLLSRLP